MPVKRRTLPSSLSERPSESLRPRDFSEPRLLRIPQAARYLNTSTFQVRELLRSGRLQKIKLGKSFLVDRSDVDTLIDQLKGAA